MCQTILWEGAWGLGMHKTTYVFVHAIESLLVKALNQENGNHSHPWCWLCLVSSGSRCQAGWPVCCWRHCLQRSETHARLLRRCRSAEWEGWIVSSTHYHSICISGCISSTLAHSCLCPTSLAVILEHELLVAFAAERATSWTLASTLKRDLFLSWLFDMRTG